MEPNNTNVMHEEDEPKIEYDMDDPAYESDKFVLSNSQELKAPVEAPASPGPSKKVQFEEFANSFQQTPPAPTRTFRKKNPKVEAFFRDVRDEEIDAAASKKMKAKLDAELKEKITLVTQIKMYLQEFPELRERAQLKKKTYSEDDDIETLRNTKKLLEQTRGMGKATTTAKAYFSYICQGIEKTLNGSPLIFGLNLTHLGEAAPKLAEGFEDELKEIAIKYSWFFYQPVELRFAFKFWQMLKEVDYMNQNGLLGSIPVPPQQMDPETAQRYDDL